MQSHTVVCITDPCSDYTLLHHRVVLHKIVFHKLYRRIMLAVYPGLPTLPCIRTLGSLFSSFGSPFVFVFHFHPSDDDFQCPSTSCLNAEICIALLSSCVYCCLECVTLQSFLKMLQHCTIQQTENPIYTTLNLVLHNFSGLYFHCNITLLNTFIWLTS